MSIPQQPAYTPGPAWPPQSGGPSGFAAAPMPGYPGAPAGTGKSPITILTGIALILAALATAGHTVWGGALDRWFVITPVLEVIAGLGAGVACFVAKRGAARPAAGVGAGMLLVPNLGSLILYLENSRYYHLADHGNWLSIPAALAALIAVVTVLIPGGPSGLPAPSTRPAPMPGAHQSMPAQQPHPGQPYQPAPQHHQIPATPQQPMPGPAPHQVSGGSLPQMPATPPHWQSSPPGAYPGPAAAPTSPAPQGNPPQ
ncbi:hypothetical protein GPX89_35350 [Nocardia sp. ET3-3]|uniref:Uncharacterized protein n=1 Tax=Nocardia terrae TaxID=2675851 RepID=A0A7K1V766_9NOCA|nr:hypothetical protein [Nocardia terrae]MVU82494.1 hypothetical protein [Nocardia terrae]